MKLRPFDRPPETNADNVGESDLVYLVTEEGDLIKGEFIERGPARDGLYQTWSGKYEFGRGLTTVPTPDSDDYPYRPCVVGWIPVEEVREFFSLEFDL